MASRSNQTCWAEGIVRELGMVMYTLLYLKWATNKDPLCSTWNSAPYGSLDGSRVWGRMIHVYTWLSPFAVYLKLS